MIIKWWKQIPNKFTNVELDSYIVMTNHLHGIINTTVGDDLRVVPISLSDIIHWFKTMTTNEYIRNVKLRNWKKFHKTLWQRSFYDHIIRDERSLNKIRDYITNNPLNWEMDNNNIIFKRTDT